MRKLISLVLMFNLARAAAPTGYKNETATAKTYAQDLVFPNNQLTKQAGLDSRIETGNTNLLVNPSFEHSTVTTGWTITNATASADTTNQVDGKKALSLSLTGALTVVQDSTINAANLVGLQGNASIKIKTSDVDGLKVCARNAGVTSTSLCVNVPKDGAWKEINIPNILTSTSNGIAITSTGTTGTVKLDAGFVGLSSPFQNVNGAKLFGSVTISGCSSAWGNASTSSFTSFGATTSCVYSTTGQAVADTSFGTTQLPSIKFASMPAGDYKIEYQGAVGTSGSTAGQWFQFSDGTTNAREISTFTSLNAGQVVTTGISQTFSYSTSKTNVTWDIRNKNASGTGYIFGTSSNTGTINVWYFPPESKIYSDFNNGYAENAGETFYIASSSCPVGTLLADGSAISRTTYSELFKSIGTTHGVGDGSTTFNLPDLRGIFVKGSGSQTIGSVTYSGTLGTKQNDQMQGHRHNWIYKNYGTTGAGGSDLDQNNQIGNTNTTKVGDPITDGTNGTPRVGSETRPANIALTPCVRLYNKNITGSFAGIEKCANDYECTDTFSADVSITGVVSNENIDWINGNGSYGGGITTLTLNSNLKDGVNGLSSPMNCLATSYNQNTIAVGNSSTTTSVAILTQVSSSLALGEYPFKIKCQKSSPDYKPKTAKISDPAALVPVVSPVVSTNIDWSTIKVATGLYTKTLSANTTFTFSNLTAGQAINVLLTNTASNYTVSWPTVKWPGGTTPTMTVGAKSDMYSFFYDGVNVYGTYVQNY